MPREARLQSWTAVLVAAGLLAGCAAGGPPPALSDSAAEAGAAGGGATAAVPVSHPAPRPGLQADGSYVLSKAELDLDCRKLSGRTLVRILQMRDHEIRTNSSAVSRAAQQVVVPIFGGSSHGADPDADYRRDRAMVAAYNRRLAEKRCKVFDLVEELQPKPAGETPVRK